MDSNSLAYGRFGFLEFNLVRGIKNTWLKRMSQWGGGGEGVFRAVTKYTPVLVGSPTAASCRLLSTSPTNQIQTSNSMSAVEGPDICC